MGKNFLTSSALTRSIEFYCQQGVENLVRQIRMETQSIAVSKNLLTSEATLSRSVCQQAVSPTPKLCQLEARSIGNGCLHSGLEQHLRETICQSPMALGRHSPISSFQPESAGTGSGSTSLESPVMVPNVTPVIRQQAPPHSPVSTFNPVSVSQQSSRHNISISCKGCIKDTCQSGKLLDTATDLVLSCPHGKTSPHNHTIPSSINGLAGVWNRIEIPFLDLSVM